MMWGCKALNKCQRNKCMQRNQSLPAITDDILIFAGLVLGGRIPMEVCGLAYPVVTTSKNKVIMDLTCG